jgi:hypothetical protein
MIPTLLIIGLLFACLAFSDTLLHGIDVSKPEKEKPPVMPQKSKINSFQIEGFQKMRNWYSIRILGKLKGKFEWIDFYYYHKDKIDANTFYLNEKELSKEDVKILIGKVGEHFKNNPSVAKEFLCYFQN